jgi:hypothetical protein
MGRTKSKYRSEVENLKEQVFGSCSSWRMDYFEIGPEETGCKIRKWVRGFIHGILCTIEYIFWLYNSGDVLNSSPLTTHLLLNSLRHVRLTAQSNVLGQSGFLNCTLQWHIYRDGTGTFCFLELASTFTGERRHCCTFNMASYCLDMVTFCFFLTSSCSSWSLWRDCLFSFKTRNCLYEY